MDPLQRLKDDIDAHTPATQPDAPACADATANEAATTDYQRRKERRNIMTTRGEYFVEACMDWRDGAPNLVMVRVLVDNPSNEACEEIEAAIEADLEDWWKMGQPC
jgi:hypothetical protein